MPGLGIFHISCINNALTLSPMEITIFCAASAAVRIIILLYKKERNKKK
jgi:hypothetical protein